MRLNKAETEIVRRALASALDTMERSWRNAQSPEESAFYRDRLPGYRALQEKISKAPALELDLDDEAEARDAEEDDDA